MQQPSSADLLEALELVREVQAAPDLDAYRQRVLGVRRLVECTEVGYNEVDAETGELFLVIDPPDAFGEPGEAEERFGRYAEQHPVYRHMRETGDPTPRTISDFLSEEEFHALEIYTELYRVVGAEDQISFLLPAPPGLVVAIALNRHTRGFSPRDRQILGLIRPHLSQAFRDATMRESLDPLSQARLSALGLTAREVEVMRLLVGGRSAADLAEELTISVHTARNHVASIYEKLGVGTRAAAVAAVLRATVPGID